MLVYLGNEIGQMVNAMKCHKSSSYEMTQITCRKETMLILQLII